MLRLSPSVVACWMLLCGSGLCPQASAQVYVPEFEETLQYIEQIRPRSTASTQSWLQRIEDELLRGDAADIAVLRSAQGTTQLDGATKQWFARCTTALEVIPPDQWPAMCEQAAAAMPDGTGKSSTENSSRASTSLAENLRRLNRQLEPANKSSAAWKKYLRWSQVEALTKGQGPATLAELNSLLRRWRNAILIWPEKDLRRAALALDRLISLRRAAIAGEDATTRAAAWTEISELATAYASGQTEAAEQLVILAEARDAVGDWHPLTRSIRNHLYAPNVVLHVHSQVFARLHAEPLEESYPIRGYYAGSYATGRGSMSGRISTDWQAGDSSARLVLRLAGTATAATNSASQGVRVSSRSSTAYNGQKVVVFDESGVRTEPATATARTTVQFSNIASGGRAPRQREAASRVYATRGAAQQDASSEVRQTTVSRLDQVGEDIAASYRNLVVPTLRRTFASEKSWEPRIRVTAGKAGLSWRCALTPLVQVPPLPATVDGQGNADVSLFVHSSAMEDYLRTMWGGRPVPGSELASELQHWFGSNFPSTESDDDSVLSFASNPSQLRFIEDRVEPTLHLTALSLGGTSYPGANIALAYRLDPANSSILHREATPEVTFSDGGESFSGRQQTLRLALQRKLDRIFPAELPVPDEISLQSGGKLRTSRMSLEGEWMRLDFDLALPKLPNAP